MNHLAPAAQNALITPRRLAPAFVPVPHWQRARDRACAALLAGETRLLVTGPAGTGKTILVDQVAVVLRAAGWHVVMRRADGASPPPPSAAPTVLFVDEADQLPRDQLDALLLHTTGPLLLAGQEPLARMVRTGTRVVLAPLGQDEACEFVVRWLGLAGRSPAHVAPDAVDRAVALSNGIPRLLSRLLDAACWLADREGRPVVDSAHVADAASMRLSVDPDPEPEPEPEPAEPQIAPRRSHLPALTGLALLVGLGFTAARVLPAQTRSAANLVTAQAAHASSLVASSLVASRFAETKPLPAHRPIQFALAQATSPRPEPAFASAPDPAATALAPIATATQPAAMPAIALQVAFDSAPASAEILDMLLERGSAMLDVGDVSAARLLFARAAETGSAAAMLSMGATFDPAMLQDRQSDPAEAGRWYRMAAASGSREAARRLERLTQQAAR